MNAQHMLTLMEIIKHEINDLPAVDSFPFLRRQSLLLFAVAFNNLRYGQLFIRARSDKNYVMQDFFSSATLQNYLLGILLFVVSLLAVHIKNKTSFS